MFKVNFEILLSYFLYPSAEIFNIAINWFIIFESGSNLIGLYMEK